MKVANFLKRDRYIILSGKSIHSTEDQSNLRSIEVHQLNFWACFVVASQACTEEIGYLHFSTELRRLHFSLEICRRIEGRLVSTKIRYIVFFAC